MKHGNTTLHPKDDMKLLLNPILSISHTNNKNNNIPSCNNKSSCKWYIYIYSHIILSHWKKRHPNITFLQRLNPAPTQPPSRCRPAPWPCGNRAPTAGRTRRRRAERRCLTGRHGPTRHGHGFMAGDGRENTHVKTHPWAQAYYSTGSLFNHW